jgi:RHS repeat-associated protein
LQWTIDAWGNRTNQTATGGTCDSFSEPVGSNNQFTNSPYQYDAAGNLLYDGEHHYTYDAEDRISTVDSGSTASYTYDAEGGRAAKTAGSTVTYYIRDLEGHVMSEYSCQTCWNVGYIYLNGGLIAIYEASTTYFVHADQLGSTRLMTAYPTPSVAECDDYYPFGELISCGSTDNTTHKFASKERDSESNLDNFEARYRSSTLGRFMSADPANAGADPTNPQSWNMYSYVLNSPVVFIDPTGMDACRAGDEPTCTVGALTDWGGPLFYDPDGQSGGQDPPPPPPPPQQQNPPPSPGGPTRVISYHPFDDSCPTSDAFCRQATVRIPPSPTLMDPVAYEAGRRLRFEH